MVDLVKKMSDAGFKTALYCIQNSRVDEHAKSLGVPVFYGYKQARVSIKDILKLKSIVVQENFQIIHSHTRYDVWLGSLTKPLLTRVWHIFSLYMSAPSKKGIVHRFIYKKVDAITSSSEILNERIRKNYPIHPSRVHLIRYGRTQSVCEKNEAETLLIRKLWDTDPGDIVFATMCRLDPAKGVREIAESFSHLTKETQKKIKIWIIGEPTQLGKDESDQPIYEAESKQVFEWLKAFIPSTQGRVKLIPFQKTPRPYFEAMDVFVLGTYKETYSLAVLDAMGVGAPVIGTNSGGTPEQVAHLSRGYLVEPQSAISIAKAIEYYMSNLNEVEKNGKCAKEWVQQQHNWQHTLSQFEALYKSLG